MSILIANLDEKKTIPGGRNWAICAELDRNSLLIETKICLNIPPFNRATSSEMLPV